MKRQALPIHFSVISSINKSPISKSSLLNFSFSSIRAIKSAQIANFIDIESTSNFKMPQTIGIAGITGKFACCVVKSLLQNPEVSIRGFCRNPSKLPPSIPASPRIHIVKGEFNDKDALESFVVGTDVVICCYLGGPELMLEGQKLLIDACVAKNVPRYIAGDFSVDLTKIPYSALPPKDPCKDIMKYLESKHIQGVHILIGVFMETFWSDFMQMWDPKQKKFSYWGTGHETWESTTYGTAADYTAAVAVDTKAVGIQHCKPAATSFQLI
jgi:hypothetical protein